MRIIDEIKSRIFWIQHGKMIARLNEERRIKARTCALKGHETRHRRYDLVPTIVQGQEYGGKP